MARKGPPDATTTRRRLEAGRGTGEGSGFRPWSLVRDETSKGRAIRVRGWTTGRVHHLFGHLELAVFYLSDVDPRIKDIRERFALLPVEETLEIARRLGYRPPTHPRTDDPLVMTSDFVLTVRGAIRDDLVVRAVVPTRTRRGLGSLRRLEHLEIERRYWDARGVDWGIVSEGDVSQDAVCNIAWFHEYRSPSSVRQFDRTTLSHVEADLARLVCGEHRTLAEAADACDQQYGFELGESLLIVRHLIASGRWVVDLEQRICPGATVTILERTATKMSRRREVTR